MTNIENLLPKYYKNSKYMHGLLHPCDVEFDKLYDKLDRTLKNLSVDDADETGIHDFETDFLIPLSDDTLELRRSKIKTKFSSSFTKDLLCIFCHARISQPFPRFFPKVFLRCG